MGSLSSTYNDHAFVLWLGLLVLTLVFGVWGIRAFTAVRRLENQVNAAFEGVSGENTARMLTEYLSTVRATATTVARVQQEHSQMAALLPSVVRHVGLVRFSPFHDTGGDQSFALAILDGRADGVVITALHSRHDSRLYAKPVERGSSRYSLTPEEREAMHRALHGTPEQAAR